MAQTSFSTSSSTEDETAAAPFPSPRGHMGAIALDGFLYAIGGCHTHDPLPIDVALVHRYDPTTDTWTGPFTASVLDANGAAQSVANTLATILVEKNRVLFSGALADIQETLGESMAELQVQIDDLVSERAVLESQIPRDNVRIAELTNQITSRQQQYNLLLSNSNQALVSQANLANALTIVQLASAPDEPSSSSPIRMTVLASAIGLLGGVALAFIFGRDRGK